MTSPGDLEQLLDSLRSVSDRRDATEPGTEERQALDEQLRTVQERIRYWSDDDHEDGLLD
jgi:hypothetical protein